MRSEREFSVGFRSYQEAKDCIARFHKNVFVSQGVKTAFEEYCAICNGVVLYNTNESDRIIAMAKETTHDIFCDDEIKLIGVGKIEEVKGFDRLARIHKRLIGEGYPVHTYILGEGSKRDELSAYLEKENIQNSFTFLGYQTNPYKFVKNCDLFVCSSHSEGFSTAATEALIVGTPVCTVEVSGMKEMLGDNNEWGIVTDNSEDALYQGIKRLLDDPALLAHYKERAAQRGKTFNTENTVRAVEEMLENL
jgi:glycosyltransferase involved in cell wall biosynthesis